MAFRKPGSKKVGLKIMAYGTTGSGKTYFGLSAPASAYVDTEAGAVHYEDEEIGKNLIVIDNSQSFSDLEDSIDQIADEHEEMGVKSLVIDSETKIQDNLQDAVMQIEEKKARLKGRDPMDANVSVRGWGKIKAINTKLQNLKIDLSSKGVNVISIAQAKEVKVQRGDQFVLDHYQPSCAKNSEFDYDVILRFFTEKDPKTGEKKFLAEVDKDRTNTVKVGSILENVTFDIWEKNADKKGEGKEVLNSSFTTDIEEAKGAYEELVDNETKTIGERVKAVMAKLAETDAEKQAAFATGFKATGATSLDTFTPKQEEKILALLAEFE